MIGLEPVVGALLEGRTFAESVATDHFKEYQQPLIVMARAHTMRSVVQSLLINGDVGGYSLADASYLSFGRVEILRQEDQQHFLLKARSAFPVELSYQGRLFENDSPPGTRPLQLLLYRFQRDEVTLATVPVERVRLDERNRFQLLGKVIEVWPTAATVEPAAFDQGPGDDFGDLSDDVQIVGEDEG